MTQAIITKLAVSAIGVALAIWVALVVAHGVAHAFGAVSALLVR